MDLTNDVQFILGEAQVLLSEKRTALSIIRSGIAVMALPLSIASLLIATSRYYAAADVLHLLIPVLAVCVILAVLGGYLVVRGLRNLHRHERHLGQLKERLPTLANILD